jgi:bifunctional DNase/RNase
MLPVRIHSLGLDTTSNQPVVLLKEEMGLRILPIWIGQPEATAILIAIEGVAPPRPMTHDLLLAVLVASGLKLERVEITRLEEATFFAALVLRGAGGVMTVDSRPSDSIALAVRAGCPILVADEIMDQAGIVPDDDAEQEVERFRDFLESVDPEDFVSS